MVTFSLKTFGCKLNQADSYLLKNLLREKFQEVSENEADIVIINSCGVIERTERKILKEIERIKKTKKKVLLAGCLPLISKEVIAKVDGVIGPKDILKVEKALNEIIKGKKPIYLQKRGINKARYCYFFDKPKNSAVFVVPISEGCLGNCSYCATKFARGKLFSFPIKDILQKVKTAVDFGFKEIHLTSQDIACFGRDKGEYQLPKLLEKIISLKGDFRIRIGMGNPSHFKQILKPMIELYKSEKIYKYLHLPVQSGSDKVLKEMRRGYTVKDFLKIVEEFRSNFCDLMLVTDIIVGFPTETSNDFKMSVDLIQKVRPRIVNITKFSKRRNTQASQLRDLPERIKTERSRFMNYISFKIRKEDSLKFLGREEKALVVERKNKYFLARPSHFRAILLKNGKLGNFFDVKIKGIRNTFLLGEILFKKRKIG